MKKVAMIHGDGYLPGNVRLEKEIRTLDEAGFDVCLLCRKCPGELDYERVGGADVTRCSRSPIVKKANLAVLCLGGFQRFPFWRRRIVELLDKVEPDIMHVQELYLDPVAIMLGTLLILPRGQYCY